MKFDSTFSNYGLSYCFYGSIYLEGNESLRSTLHKNVKANKIELDCLVPYVVYKSYNLNEKAQMC